MRPAKRALDRGRDRERAGDEARGDALGLVGELDQRERVAAGRAVQPHGAAVGHAARVHPREQLLRRAERETLDRERGQAGIGERGGLARADGDEHRDGSASSAPGGEEDGVGGWLIEPAGRRRRARTAARSSAAAASRPSVAAPITSRSPRTPGPSASAARSAAACGAGSDEMRPSTGRSSSSSPANGIDASPSKPRAREHAHVAGVLGGVGEQRALADAGLAADHEHSARADARVGEQAADRCALRVATEQHRPSMTQRRRDCGPGGPPDAKPCGRSVASSADSVPHARRSDPWQSPNSRPRSTRTSSERS